ncbi:MAG: hypothetical protein QOE52_107 [Mycobacterium sp.]|jgi:hypothetical protein|nr:hypothetical protein [Mycobacterium sp.]
MTRRRLRIAPGCCAAEYPTAPDGMAEIGDDALGTLHGAVGGQFGADAAAACPVAGQVEARDRGCDLRASIADLIG